MLLLAALVLTPVIGTAADKPGAKKSVKSSIKTPASETSEPTFTNKPVATHISAAIAALKADPEAGHQINGVCAACHGDSGQGGKKGEYPRLAGQNVEYLMDQLHKFKDRKRTNLPMFPYTEERELPDEDLVHIAAYLASIKLDTSFPVFKESDDALTRLLAVEKVLNIPRSEGDVDVGAKIYKTECSSCHKKDGMGHKTVPMLAGQYTTYLKRQVEKFIKGERIHDVDMKDPSKDVLNLLKPEEIRDILAFLTTLDD
ncbi:cytochrome c, class I [Sulfuricella denitrificans skB26]|uniref:Cytochrome c, class I n=1 Tax=Sulfuricella denitrificans (strain DSM 22764 / NBRC 105220 / skB26) TaxID=1163617 RepID=S6ACN8_SULDS|nr:cytochrome c, class I [Sulfuricella denitrificans skB26]